MIGAIIGDIIGSVFEHINIKTTDFELFTNYSTFTDDTVLTIAIADSILSGQNYSECLKYWGNKYPNAGYGLGFHKWLRSPCNEPYYSWGNGSAMRVSPVGFAFEPMEKVIKEAKKTAEVTHNHPEGIKGAQAIAACILMARKGKSKTDIKEFVKNQFSYDLDRTLESIRPNYHFDISCQGSVPEAIIAFLESTDYEDAIRKAVSLGGDSDTIACMSGGIAQAFYKKIPNIILEIALDILPEELLNLITNFEKRFGSYY